MLLKGIFSEVVTANSASEKVSFLFMEQEIWKDIPWYEWKYQVSNLWNIFSLPYKKLLKCNLNKCWYKIVWLSINNKRSNYSVHRLVAQAFIYNKQNKNEVNHINWIKTDNRAENLDWVTRSENCIHKYRVLKKYRYIRNVIQYSVWWEFIKKWHSVFEVERVLMIDHSSIYKNCNWKNKSAWWFIWRYE